MALSSNNISSSKLNSLDKPDCSLPLALGETHFSLLLLVCHGYLWFLSRLYSTGRITKFSAQDELPAVTF